MPQISVIMPVYNGGEFLQEALNSILNQSFKDFEFLICDDCSLDGSAGILAAAAADKRIKLFRNEKNSGVTYSLNRLLGESQTELIARMDADDIAMPERLRLQYEFMQQHSEVAVVGGQLEIIDEKSQTIGFRSYPDDMQMIRRNILCANPLAHPAVMMRREAVLSMGGYDNFSCCEDYDLWLRLAAKNYEMANLPDCLLRYRLSANQIKQRNMKKSLWATINLQKKFLFCRNFFSLKAVIIICAEFALMLFPNKFLLKLFKQVAYKK